MGSSRLPRPSAQFHRRKRGSGHTLAEGECGGVDDPLSRNDVRIHGFEGQNLAILVGGSVDLAAANPEVKILIGARTGEPTSLRVGIDPPGEQARRRGFASVFGAERDVSLGQAVLLGAGLSGCWVRSCRAGRGGVPRPCVAGRSIPGHPQCAWLDMAGAHMADLLGSDQTVAWRVTSTDGFPLSGQLSIFRAHPHAVVGRRRGCRARAAGGLHRRPV